MLGAVTRWAQVLTGPFERAPEVENQPKVVPVPNLRTDVSQQRTERFVRKLSCFLSSTTSVFPGFSFRSLTLASSAKGSLVTAGGEEERVPAPPGSEATEHFSSMRSAGWAESSTVASSTTLRCLCPGHLHCPALRRNQFRKHTLCTSPAG